MNELIQDNNGIWVDKEESKLSYPEAGNVDCFAVEENSFWFNHRNDIIKAAITRFPFSGNFSDLGGGNGYQAKFISGSFPHAKVFLVEPGYQGCLNGKKRGLKDVYNVVFQKFDFAGNAVNAAGLFDVLEHIEDDADFLIQLKEALPAGSLIYLTVPAHMYLWSDVDNYGGHFRRYNKKMVEALLQKTKLELVYFSYFFMYVPFITYLVRRIPYLLRGKRKNTEILAAETDNHQPSGFFLSIFNFFHWKEIQKIKSSTIHHGGSCLIIFKT